MKIESIAVTAEGLVTVAFRIAGNEALEEGDISRVFEIAREVGGERPLAVARTAAPIAQNDANALEAEPIAPPPEGRRRRRTVDGAAPEAAPEATANPPEPRGRRRRAAPVESQPEPATPAASQTGTAPTSRRRRAPAEAASATPQTAPATSANVQPAASQSPSEVTDADLMKAASQAAAKLTPLVVNRDILSVFGVTRINELKGDDRRGFLDAVKFALSNAS